MSNVPGLQKGMDRNAKQFILKARLQGLHQHHPVGFDRFLFKTGEWRGLRPKIHMQYGQAPTEIMVFSVILEVQ